MLALAARFNVERGAQIIDINMGCPARKVCNVAAGSALLADEPLAIRIVEAVVEAVGQGPDAVPVTVKMRTGPRPDARNAVRLAQAFVDAGAAMITLHGRTRACGFRGAAEYETIAEVKAALHGARRVPVVANGDIQTPQQALDVLSKTGADAIMIGRAAQGRPWIFREILGFIDRGEIIAPPSLSEIRGHLTQHLLDHYQFHGEYSGVRTARKHMGWYSQAWHGGQALRERFNQLESAEDQLALIDAWFLEAADRTNSCPDEPFIAAFPSLN
jgi:tRNA-dihydrouridine synthase B